MSETPYMPLWVGDFIAKTQSLDAKEVGAYMLLLMALWSHGGYLPNDQRKLRLVARCGRDWPKIWDSIGSYFTADGDRITQARLLDELQKVAAKRAVNAQSGARGGRAKALKTKEQALANATVSLKQSEPYSKKDTPNGVSKKAAPRGSRLPQQWRLPKDWGEWAVAEGWPPDAVRAEAEKFRDYWIAAPGQKAVKLDWLATWRNWMRNSNARKGSTNGNGTFNGTSPGRGDRTGHGALVAAFADAARDDRPPAYRGPDGPGDEEMAGRPDFDADGAILRFPTAAGSAGGYRG